MNVTQIDTRDRAQARAFLALPFRLYRDSPLWVPPVASDAALMLDRRKHPFYSHSDAAFFLAHSDGRVVGRLAVLDNRSYNTYHGERTAFFYLFECEDDTAAACALFEAGRDWARGRGLERLHGPKGFGALDGMGLLVKGFEHRPALGIPYNPPYYERLLQAAGFEGYDDELSGYLDARLQFPENVMRGAELVQKRRGLRVARFRTRGDLRAVVPHLKDLYNRSLAGTYGNIPVTDAEAKTLADQIIWFSDPRLIKVIFKGDEPVGFLLAYPDISAALQRTGGQMLPLGILHVLLELRRTKWINVNGAGILPEYRGLGGTALLFSEMYRSVSETRYRHADLVQISTANDRMQRELRELGIDFYKVHRLYQRAV